MNMKIDVLTLFPDLINQITSYSIINRAKEKGIVDIHAVNIRDFATDKHRTVDDRPYGGGAGMVMKVDVVAEALKSVRQEGSKVILTGPKGIPFTQSVAQFSTSNDHMIFIAGHYEGIDDRIRNYIDEEWSLGDFVMTGGELAIGCFIDSIVRLIPGVLEKEDATQEESFATIPLDELIQIVGKTDILADFGSRNVNHVTLLEYPHYTRPEMYEGFLIPEILLTGNHKLIYEWRIRQAYNITVAQRKDILLASK